MTKRGTITTTDWYCPVSSDYNMKWADYLRAKGKKVALAHFRYINPLPKNTAEVLKKYPKVVVAEQNMGQLAAWLRMKVDGFVPMQFNQVKGQPFVVNELVEAFTDILNKE